MTFGEYQQSAHSYSRLDDFEDPTDTLGSWLMSEIHEVWFDNEDARRAEILLGASKPDLEESIDIAKEFGDVLWFISEDLSLRQRSLDKLAKISLLRNAGVMTTMDRIPIARFDQESLAKGGAYRVENFKMKPFLEDENKHLAHQVLAENPGYILGRVFARLSRALWPRYRQFADESGPVSNLQFEPDRLIDMSRADSLWIISWVGQTVLGTTLEEIAELNLEKLSRRQAAGTILSGQDVDRSK